MANKVNVKINLAGLKGMFKYTINGKSSSKECICIPVEMLFQGKNGAMYLDLMGIDAQGKYGNLYSLKQMISYEQYKSMSQEERNAMPFIGNISEAKASASTPSQASAPQYAPAKEELDGDLPF